MPTVDTTKPSVDKDKVIVEDNNKDILTKDTIGDLGLSNYPADVVEIVDSLNDLLISNDFSSLERISRVGKGEFSVLRLLLESDHPLSPTYLSKTLNSSKGRISAILGSLEKRGECVRETDPNNRRSVMVTITDPGRNRICSELTVYNTLLAGVIQKLGTEDARTLIALLDKTCKLTNDSNIEELPKASIGG